jgi:hypothetical protein
LAEFTVNTLEKPLAAAPVAPAERTTAWPAALGATPAPVKPLGLLIARRLSRP